MKTSMLVVVLVLASAVSFAKEDKKDGSAVAALNELITKNGLVTFRAWNGKRVGMDADTEITFLPEQRVHMTEYGYGVYSYEGSYRIDANGEVTSKFEGFGHEWPVMLLQQDSTSLLLRPKDPKTGFVMGNRGGAVIQGGRGTYWPFRPIPAQEQANVKLRLKK
jgi:hypothetical protein